MYVPAKATTLPILQKLATDKGLSFDAVAVASPAGDAMKLKPVRIGLWDQLRRLDAVRLDALDASSSTSSRSRSSFRKTLDAGNLNAKYDVLVFVDGGIPERDSAAGGGGSDSARQPARSDPGRIPRTRLGRVTRREDGARARRFVENGGTILTIGSSTRSAITSGCRSADALVERVAGGAERAAAAREVLHPRHDPRGAHRQHEPARLRDGQHGAMVFCDESPAFRSAARGALKGVKPVAWFDSATPLRSGWAWGQQYLDQAVRIVDAPVGKGRVVLFGPEVAWRAQPHGTFKMFFNGIYTGAQ